MTIYFLMQMCFLIFCSKIRLCMNLFRNTLPWPKLQLLRVSHFNEIASSVDCTFFGTCADGKSREQNPFPDGPQMALRRNPIKKWFWHWFGRLYERLYERSPQYAFNKT